MRDEYQPGPMLVVFGVEPHANGEDEEMYRPAVLGLDGLHMLLIRSHSRTFRVERLPDSRAFWYLGHPFSQHQSIGAMEERFVRKEGWATPPFSFHYAGRTVADEDVDYRDVHLTVTRWPKRRFESPFDWVGDATPAMNAVLEHARGLAEGESFTFRRGYDLLPWQAEAMRAGLAKVDSPSGELSTLT